MCGATPNSCASSAALTTPPPPRTVQECASFSTGQVAALLGLWAHCKSKMRELAQQRTDLTAAHMVGLLRNSRPCAACPSRCAAAQEALPGQPVQPKTAPARQGGCSCLSSGACLMLAQKLLQQALPQFLTQPALGCAAVRSAQHEHTHLHLHTPRLHASIDFPTLLLALRRRCMWSALAAPTLTQLLRTHASGSSLTATWWPRPS